MSNPKKKYILYGASFNPPHMGHFSAIRQLLEEYDKVIVFPYPHKNNNGFKEKILPIKNRLEMLQLFVAEFFPQISERLLLVNLAQELKQKDKRVEGSLHTYDYLVYMQDKINTLTTDLHVCLGIDAQNSIEKASFFKEDEIKKDFGVFYLMEEKQVSSQEIREFLKQKKVIKSNKDEKAIVQYLGYHVSQYVIEKNLYGLVNKKVQYAHKTAPAEAAPTDDKETVGVGHKAKNTSKISVKTNEGPQKREALLAPSDNAPPDVDALVHLGDHGLLMSSTNQTDPTDLTDQMEEVTASARKKLKI